MISEIIFIMSVRKGLGFMYQLNIETLVGL
jgi:hypothetical protein